MVWLLAASTVRFSGLIDVSVRMKNIMGFDKKKTRAKMDELWVQGLLDYACAVDHPSEPNQ